MGDEIYTAEEKVILGEEPEPQAADQATPPVTEEKPEGEVLPEGEKPAETKEPEHTDDEKAEVEKMGLKIDDKGFVVDEEGTRIPAKRWKQLYYESKDAQRKATAAETGRSETETKFKLFKVLGSEKYYEIHPDEAPKGYKPAGKAAVTEDPFEMVATYPDPNHPFHGKTLKEIYKEDPAEGRKLERAWEQSQQTQRQTQQQVHQTYVREAEREIDTFSTDIAKELFGKEPSALTKEESAQVTVAIQSTLDFMNKTRRGAGILGDAYFLMNKEKIVTDAKTKGGKAALESLQKPSIPSISAGSGAAGTGSSAYEGMTTDQLARVVEGMSDKQATQFFKNASPALKAKHPSIPWD